MKDFAIIFGFLCGGVIALGFVGGMMMRLLDHFLR